MHAAFAESAAGIGRKSVLGQPMTCSFGNNPSFLPSEAQILEVSKCRGRPQPHVANILRSARARSWIVAQRSSETKRYNDGRPARTKTDTRQ
jgi:hypothetical protein